MKSPSNVLIMAAEAIAHRNVELRSFLLRLLNPDDLGYSVGQEVRNEVIHILNISHITRDRKE